MTLVLCFSGQIGSGKSSVSAAMAERLGWKRTGFGDYLRSEVERLRKDADGRLHLQDLGQQKVDDDPVRFCKEVLAFGGIGLGDNAVVDGIRHASIFDIIATICAPADARLIYLGAGETTRLNRIKDRLDAEDFERASKHRVEADLTTTLPTRAHGVIDADEGFDRVIADCMAFVQSWIDDAGR